MPTRTLSLPRSSPSPILGSIRGQLKAGWKLWIARTKGERAQSSCIIRETQLGDAIYRFNLAVHYGGTRYLFYSVDMVHVDDGWEMVYFTANSDLNVILNTPWPFK